MKTLRTSLKKFGKIFNKVTNQNIVYFNELKNAMRQYGIDNNIREQPDNAFTQFFGNDICHVLHKDAIQLFYTRLEGNPYKDFYLEWFRTHPLP